MNHILDDADRQIIGALGGDAEKSYFLHAGAGAGKTSSLIVALQSVIEHRSDAMLASGERVGVVTYTNAASDEISRRLSFSPLVDVSTIHSFAWRMIKDFTADLVEWLIERIRVDLEELRLAEQKGRAGTKASEERLRKIARQELRLERLPETTKFLYSPTQTRVDRDGLSHSEVLAAFSFFVVAKKTFRSILVGRYPILLVDEVQDTNKHVLEALLFAETENAPKFLLGLFGDTMQRVYMDGLPNLEQALPGDWLRPSKTINYRSTARVVSLANAIRAGADSWVQTPRDGASAGAVRLFLALDTSGRDEIERQARQYMAETCEDELWTADDGVNVKTLILEHAMAARRLGFESFLNSFAADPDLRATLVSRDSANSPQVHFLGAQLAELASAIMGGNAYLADLVLKKYSPLLNAASAKVAPSPGGAQLEQARTAVLQLQSILRETTTPTLRQLMDSVRGTNLLELPDVLRDALLHAQSHSADDPSDAVDVEVAAWAIALDTDVQQFQRFYDYVCGSTQYDTHQGVKGLEFPNVMVILDDLEARGFLFNYSKLFTASPLSKTDLEHLANGEESVIDRSRRLLYVASTRAIQALAVVLYTSDIASARTHAIAAGWFEDGEIVTLESPSISGL